MAQALTHIRAAGLSVGLTDDLRLIVRPSSLITPELREFAKAHRDELIACLLAEQAVPAASRFPLTEPCHSPPPAAPALTHAEWATLDKAYQAHHAACPVCIAAGKGYGLRCGTGAALWANYDQASEPPRTNPARKDVRQ